MDDLISRRAAIDEILDQPPELHYPSWYAEQIKALPPVRLTNRQWVDFLSAQFDISRTSAKEMLHGMMQWKKEDNFKKLFNGGGRHESRPYQQTGNTETYRKDTTGSADDG